MLVLKRAAGGGVAAIVLIAVIMGATSRLWQFGVASPFTDPLDFRAFYCAGAAVAQRSNPYRLEPDRSCQRNVLSAAGLRLNERFVLPAPLPPYALVALAPLASLPFRVASELWMALNLLALICSIFLIRKLSGAPLAFIGLSLFLSVGLVCLALGQPIPIVLAAVLLAARCARSGNGAGAAVGATLASLEPHLALPVWLGLIFFLPAARKPLAFAAGVICVLSCVPGPALNLEYLHSVLPQHARAELMNFEGQYGLSSLLYTLGVAPEAALRAGTACYAVMLAFGLMLGMSLQRRTGNRAFLVAAPVAAVVLGGPFLHIQQTVVAIPLAFMLVAPLRRQTATFCIVAVATLFLSIPWPLLDMFLPQVHAAAVRGSITRHTAMPHAENPNESIEVPYAAFIAEFERRAEKHSVEELVARKVPTWFALLAILTVAAYLAFGAGKVGRTQDLSRAA